MSLKFPKNFYWGSATSAHQVEGNNINDWSEWEKTNAKRLTEEVKAKWQPWQQEKFPEMFEPENYISGRACDHYHRYKEDFNIAKSLGQNAHRFSIEWSRIEPEEGKFDEKEIEHYRKVILALRQRGIEPFVTLWHWPVPLWLEGEGGVKSRNFINYFQRYAKKITNSFKNEVKFWITLNEPEVYAANSYLKGEWPPCKKNLFVYLKALSNLTVAHKKAFLAIKSIDAGAQVGVAKHNVYFEAYKNKLINRLFKKFIDWWWNFYFLNQIKNYQDFIGLNYYFHNRIIYGFNKNENKIVSDLGWELYPEGIYHVLKDLKKYKKPIYITENGIADAQDKKRIKFIKDHLFWVHKAIQEGVDVRGYFYWSLLDNFEWDKGFWLRFGLVEIDYKTMGRKIRPSAWEYAKICKENKLEISN